MPLHEKKKKKITQEQVSNFQNQFPLYTNKAAQSGTAHANTVVTNTQNPHQAIQLVKSRFLEDNNREYLRPNYTQEPLPHTSGKGRELSCLK